MYYATLMYLEKKNKREEKKSDNRLTWVGENFP